MATFSDIKSDKLGFQSVAFRTCCLCNLTFNKPPQIRHKRFASQSMLTAANRNDRQHFEGFDDGASLRTGITRPT